MISANEALRLLEERTSPLGTETVSLDVAHGRILAAEVQADRDFPPTDRSAMDGFAVRAEDASEAGRVLQVVGEIPAGRPVGTARVGSGEAIRIFTGSVVPPGADSVVMVERTEEDRSAGTVRIDAPPEPGQHIRRRAEELRRGDVVLEPGVPIHAPEIAALASVGCVEVPVYRRPTVHVLATGDEIVPAEKEPGEHELRNSNAWMLRAQLRELELPAGDLGIAPDDAQGLAERIRQGLAGDVLVISGGVSVGEYDLVASTLERAGMNLVFHKIAVRPGKPLLAGLCGACWVFGLPGNPRSAYTGFALFAAPAIRRLMGARSWANRRVTATLAAPLRAKPGRETYHLVRLEPEDGRYAAHPVPSAGSGDVLSLARANGFLVTSAATGDVDAGTELPAILWRDSSLRTGTVHDSR